jgi:hypothetical protein
VKIDMRISRGLRFLAVVLMLGSLNLLQASLRPGSEAARLQNFESISATMLALLGIGAAYGLWKAKRWGATLLVAFGVVAFSRLVPSTPELVDLLLPAAFYAVLIAYAWDRTAPSRRWGQAPA